jgi:hypothetical protein
MVKHVVHGILFYYPYMGGRETRPVREEKPFARRTLKRTRATVQSARATASNKRSSASASASAGSGSAGGKGGMDIDDSPTSDSALTVANAAAEVDEDVEVEDDDDDDEDYVYELDSDDDEQQQDIVQSKTFQTISVLWQNRLVPLSTLIKLPFFPTASSKSQCDSELLPEKWRNRLKGYIFFDWKFHHISNNKLRIQVDPAIGEWMNHRDRVKQITYTPQATKQAFLK